MRPWLRRPRRLLPDRSTLASFALSFTLVMAALVGISYLAISASIDQARTQLLERIEAGERQTVAAMQREAASTLLEVTADLEMFRTVFNRVSASPEVNRRIERFLVDFMGSHRSYDQLRLIGPDGVEKIRVNNEGGGPELVPSHRLQDKSDTSYVQLAKDLDMRSILITPLDVNRENGEIEVPLNLVIRVLGKTSFAEGGAPALLVFNYRAAILLENMREIGGTAIGQPKLVSARGVEAFAWLDVETREALAAAIAAPSFADRYPDVWEALQQDATQRIEDGRGGLIVASKLQPSALPIPDSIGQKLDFTVPMSGAPDQEGYWFVLSHIDGGTMDGFVRLGLRLSRSTQALFAGVLLALGWLIALRLSSYRSDASRMRVLATTDALTGLLNRGEFERRLSIAVAHAARYNRATALLYIDLDGFKAINDRRGHAVGDALLRHVAEILQATVRGTDAAGRLGGDEFAVLLTEVRGRSDMQAVAGKLRKQLNCSIELEGEIEDIAASVGGAAFPHDAENVGALLEAADRAMYTEKKARKRERLAAF